MGSYISHNIDKYFSVAKLGSEHPSMFVIRRVNDRQHGVGRGLAMNDSMGVSSMTRHEIA
jgi:hypothetical protein